MQAITNDMIHIRYADGDEPLAVLNAVIQRYGDKAAFMLVPDSLWEKFGKGTPYQRSVRKRTKRNYRRGFTANQTTGI